MNEIPTRYNPKEVEDRWYKFWEEKGYFHVEPDPSKKPFCIVIPPPNITGILHMGHALNNTIQDILIRWKRMQGYLSLWLPGTDHAGIATQNVVERKLAQEGKRRQDLGREEFLKEVWKWREEYGSTIIRQLKRLGSSCDWERLRFTMDEGLSAAVLETFVRLFDKGLIYRGYYIVNWCPRCQTALSDEEAPHKDIQGKLYYIRYPMESEESKGKYITVATTRPETMLGDVAVAVHPEDKRYKALLNKKAILPIMNRRLGVLTDTMVDSKFGTGAVKVTPAHDPYDFEIAVRHKLGPIVVMNPDGTMNRNAGDYEGMDRFECREAILEDLKERGLLEKVTEHLHAVGHCYRCHTVIEPYLSNQWFVRMAPLAGHAIKVVKEGKIKFHPKRWTKVYLNWMENIRDWCISRQIWWGHRIPVWYCRDCYKPEDMSFIKVEAEAKARAKAKTDKNFFSKLGINVCKDKPNSCVNCGGSNFYQDEDVLDTWFSSWLWPFSTLGWPKTEGESADLGYFYPTSVLVTAPEILFFWVARMIMAGLEFMGEIPFKDVYIHGTVRDITGMKMSKSLGNIIDPLDIIEEFGADALRFSLISITATGQDVFLSREKFESGRNFANKIWNASRFILMNMRREVIDVDLCTFFQREALSLPDRWILSRFYTTLRELNKSLERYRFNDAAKLLYDFFWHQFCDWYLELVKPNIEDKNTQVILYKVLEKSLRLLHPLTPFVTEDIWQRLPHTGESIMVQPWPHLQEKMIDKKSEGKMQLIIELIVAIRNLRNQVNIAPSQKATAVISVSDKRTKDILEENASYIKTLTKLEKLEVDINLKRPRQVQAVSAIIKEIEIFMPLKGLIDKELEEERISKRIREIEEELRLKKEKLNDPSFLKKAPRDVVEREKAKSLELKENLRKLKQIRNVLK